MRSLGVVLVFWIEGTGGGLWISLPLEAGIRKCLGVERCCIDCISNRQLHMFSSLNCSPSMNAVFMRRRNAVNSEIVCLFSCIGHFDESKKYLIRFTCRQQLFHELVGIKKERI